MKNSFGVRRVRLSDARTLAEIYRPYVENTAVSFEYYAPDEAEFRRRIAEITQKYPFFVAVYNGRVIGYAYASPFKNREAYDISAEVSVYVEQSSHRKGVGRLLYTVLERDLLTNGFDNAYACIAYPDKEDETLTYDSVRFHSAMGYRICGKFEHCAMKFGNYYNMTWMGKKLTCF